VGCAFGGFWGIEGHGEGHAAPTSARSRSRQPRHSALRSEAGMALRTEAAWFWISGVVTPEADQPPAEIKKCYSDLVGISRIWFDLVGIGRIGI